VLPDARATHEPERECEERDPNGSGRRDPSPAEQIANGDSPNEDTRNQESQEWQVLRAKRHQASIPTHDRHRRPVRLRRRCSAAPW